MAREDKPPESEENEVVSLSTREKIVQSALEVFAEKGLHGATVVEIAKAARITGGALYRYFDSKEDIFRAVVEAHSGSMQALDIVRDLMPELEPKTALKLIARGIFLVIYSDWDFIRMIVGEAVKNPDAAAPFTEKVMNPAREFIADTISLWKDKGILKDSVDPAIATVFLLGTLGYLLVEKDIMGLPELQGYEVPELMDQLIDMFLEGILK
ncbi:MAG: TetR/AcrR family transcriptional regulator [Actinomycetota bacterium]|nr:TetR/AcrR family transcriptional regulator [Actinomycetota bacterium]